MSYTLQFRGLKPTYKNKKIIPIDNNWIRYKEEVNSGQNTVSKKIFYKEKRKTCLKRLYGISLAIYCCCFALGIGITSLGALTYVIINTLQKVNSLNNK